MFMFFKKMNMFSPTHQHVFLYVRMTFAKPCLDEPLFIISGDWIFHERLMFIFLKNAKYSSEEFVLKRKMFTIVNHMSVKALSEL